MGKFLHKLGPGLIFAAAAIGVSHLAQSTRAGAGWGLAMTVFIIGANLMKYPAFRFGPHYAAATNRSLLQGYRDQGMWALVLYGLLTLGTMFGVQAGVTIVTAGILKAWLGLSASPLVISVGLMVACGGLLSLGRYHWLDRVTKVLVATLTIATLIATAVAIPYIDWGAERLFLTASEFDLPTMLFLAALIGWMPSAIDVSVWNSLWTLAKSTDDGEPVDLDNTMVDFHVGYIGTAFLAICFMLLGTGVMHGRGMVFENAPGQFAAQVIDLYALTLGDWSRPLIGFAAFAVMFSTTLAVLDGFPRAIGVLVTRFVRDEAPDDNDLTNPLARRSYWIAMAILAAGAAVIIGLLQTSIKGLVDTATTLSFLTAPLLAILNHRAVFSHKVPAELQPSKLLRVWSLVGIVLMMALAVGWLLL